MLSISNEHNAAFGNEAKGDVDKPDGEKDCSGMGGEYGLQLGIEITDCSGDGGKRTG